MIPLFFSLIMSITQAFAGTISGGGGGNAVVCFDDPAMPARVRGEAQGLLLDEFMPHVTSVEMFDLFEARLERGIDGNEFVPEVERLSAGETFVNYLLRVENMLRYSVPDLHKLYERSKSQLRPHNIVFQPHGVDRIDDAAAVGIIDTHHCVLATMGLHLLDGDFPVLHVDGRLFHHPSHSELSKAIFYLHEIFYMAGRRLGHASSRNTRALMGHLITLNNQLNARQLADEAIQLGFLPATPLPLTYIEEIHRDVLRLAQESIYRELPAILREEGSALFARFNEAFLPQAHCDGPSVTQCLDMLPETERLGLASPDVISSLRLDLTDYGNRRVQLLRGRVIELINESGLLDRLDIISAPFDRIFVDVYLTAALPQAFEQLLERIGDWPGHSAVINRCEGIHGICGWSGGVTARVTQPPSEEILSFALERTPLRRAP